jgi:hypothetical protein
MPYRGVIIEESLADKSLLKDIKIVSTKVEPVTSGDKHATPWIGQWTLHTVEVPEEKAALLAESISHALDKDHAHAWYADYKTETDHYIIFSEKVFHITDRASKDQYDEAARYGVGLGIPPYQVDFSPYVPEWKR